MIANSIDVGTESTISVQVQLNYWHLCNHFTFISTQLDKDTQSILCVAICNSKGVPIGLLLNCIFCYWLASIEQFYVTSYPHRKHKTFANCPTMAILVHIEMCGWMIANWLNPCVYRAVVYDSYSVFRESGGDTNKESLPSLDWLLKSSKRLLHQAPTVFKVRLVEFLLLQCIVERRMFHCYACNNSALTASSSCQYDEVVHQNGCLPTKISSRETAYCSLCS